MDKIVFTQSAFNHGFAESDFYELISGRYLKLRSQRGLADVYELLGQNFAGDYLHIVYRKDKQTNQIKVFHMSAMSESQKRRYRRIIKK